MALGNRADFAKTSRMKRGRGLRGGAARRQGERPARAASHPNGVTPFLTPRSARAQYG